MAKLPPLDQSAPLALQRLRDEYERTLLRTLTATKATHISLVLTHRIALLLAHVFVNGLAVLKSNGVSECLELSDDLSKVTGSTVVYLAFPRVEAIRSVALHASQLMQQTATEQPSKTFFLYATGKWNTFCDEVLEQYQLKDHFHVDIFPMGFIPLDTDLLTMGYERCLYDCYIAGNRSSLLDVASALDMLQRVYGKFAHIKYKGELSMVVLNHLMDLNATSNAEVNETAEKPNSQLDTLVLLDRCVDFVSTLCTPLTYEALVDEILHITDGFLNISSKILTSDSNASDTIVPIPLNSTDRVFKEIRSMNIHTIPPVLNGHATAIKGAFSHFQSVSATASAAEVHDFVKTVPQMKESQQSLEQHVNILENIETFTSTRSFRHHWQVEHAILNLDENALEDILEMIYQHEPLLKVIRLLCLYSVVNGGLDRKDLEKLKLHLVRAYGHELVFSFENLERMRLFHERQRNENGAPVGSKNIFQYITDSLQVIDSDINLQNPKSAAFVTSGYAPISCRLVEEILKMGDWKKIDGVMNHLHGPRAEVHLVGHNQNMKTKKKKKKPIVVVFFIGGVTLLDIAALRWISTYYPFEIVIGGTSVINGNTFLSELLERLPSTTV